MSNSPRERALAAIAALPSFAPVPALEFTVGNRLAIIGDPDVAFGWGERVQQACAVIVLATAHHHRLAALRAAHPDALVLPVDRAAIEGHAGAYRVLWECGDEQGKIACDLILDLQATPHWSGFELPVGYFAPGSDPLDQALAVLALVQLIGEWEKPRYVRFSSALCAHERNRIGGCSRCLEVCDTQAIRPSGDHVAIDPYWCQGCGDCVGVCPTGAVRFQYPRPADWSTALSAALDAWSDETPCTLLCYDERWRGALAQWEAEGGELPDHFLPLPIWRTTIFNEEWLLYALLRGVAQIVLVSAAEMEKPALLRAAAIVQTVFEALGDPYAAERVSIVCETTPEALTKRFSAPLSPYVSPGRFRFRLQTEKNDSMRLIRDALAKLAAERQVDAPVLLPSGSSWGAVAVTDRCTLCFACTGVCPTQALQAGGGIPKLQFTEARCVQCGLCANTCPEQAIELTPRWNPSQEANQAVILRQSEPAYCAECGAVLGPRSVLDKMVATLQSHPLFGQPDRQLLLRLCADCRVKAQFRETDPVRIWEL